MAACHSTDLNLPAHPMLLGGDALSATRTSDGRWLPSYPESVTLPAGGLVGFFNWGWIIDGRRDQLVADRVVPGSWFERTAVAGRLFYPRIEPIDGREVGIRGRGRDRVSIRVRMSEDDRKAAYSNGQEVTIRAAVAEGESRLPIDADDYRRKAAQCMGELFGLVRQVAAGGGGGWGGYSFDPDVLDGLDDLRDDLLAVLRNGTVRFDRARHDGTLRQLRAPLAKIDEGLQRFLASVAESGR